MSLISRLPFEIILAIVQELDNPSDIASLLGASRMFHHLEVVRRMYETAVVRYNDTGDQLTRYVLASMITGNLRAFRILSPYLMQKDLRITGPTHEWFVARLPEDLRHEIEQRMILSRALVVMAGYYNRVLPLLKWFISTTKEGYREIVSVSGSIYAASIGSLGLYEVCEQYTWSVVSCTAIALREAIDHDQFSFVENMIATRTGYCAEILQEEATLDRPKFNLYEAAMRKNDTRALEALISCYKPVDEVFYRVFGTEISQLLPHRNALSYLVRNGLRPTDQLLANIGQVPDLYAELTPSLKDLPPVQKFRWDHAARMNPGSLYHLATTDPSYNTQSAVLGVPILDIIYSHSASMQLPLEESLVLERMRATPQLLEMGKLLIKWDNLARAAALGHLEVLRTALPILEPSSEVLRLPLTHTAAVVCAAVEGAKNNPKCLDCVHFLLGRVNINAVGPTLTPLEVACQSDDLQMVRLLIKYGAGVNSIDCLRTPEQSTLLETLEFHPLWQAAQNRNIECVKLLIDNGAKLPRTLIQIPCVYQLLFGVAMARQEFEKTLKVASLLLDVHPEMASLTAVVLFSTADTILSALTSKLVRQCRENRLIILLMGIWLHGVPEVSEADINGPRSYNNTSLHFYWDLLYRYNVNPHVQVGRQPAPIATVRQCSGISRMEWDNLAVTVARAASADLRKQAALAWLSKFLPRVVVTSDLEQLGHFDENQL
ncbi:hypothetical protein KEM54_005530 [Ascosphaera aggregata]|nr:hypothetical protein KEM54_005530 [Ascosphaera aggregata]